MISEKTIKIVKSTAPLIAQTGTKLTTHFYKRMFKHHPELLDIFNMSNQTKGAQQEALFNAICAYANNIDNLAAVLPVVEKIAQKHSSFMITEAQYNIVGEHLLASIDELLSPGQEVIDAWAEAYGVLAHIFITREEDIYKENENKSGGWRGKRAFVLTEKKAESQCISSFTFKAVDGKNVSHFMPGQYIGIYLHPSQFKYQEIRQYSLSCSPRDDSYRISVKRDVEGVVSNYLHNELNVGDVVSLSSPAGDFFLDITESRPVTLISAGVGLTPMLSMLESLTAHNTSVTWLHATENGQTHAFKKHVQALIAKHSHMQSTIWYNSPLDSDLINEDYQHQGFMKLDALFDKKIDPNMHYYICGPIAFMQYVAHALTDLKVPNENIHYECFGPNKII